MSTRSQEQAELSRWRLLPGKANRSWFSALIASEFAAPGALVAQQDRRLAQILAFASEHVPFYRARFDVLGLHVADIKGQHDLPRLPILSKHEVIEHFDECARRRSRKAHIYRVQLNPPGPPAAR